MPCNQGNVRQRGSVHPKIAAFAAYRWLSTLIGGTPVFLRRLMLVAAVAGAIAAQSRAAESQSTPGVSDTQIKIGQTIPIAGRPRLSRRSGGLRRPITAWSTTPAGSTAARSISSRSTTATARPRRSSRPDGSSSRTRSSAFSARSAPRPTPRCSAISTSARCRRCFCSPAPRAFATRSITRGRWAAI